MEEDRPGSENGSENSYVQVSKEDAQMTDSPVPLVPTDSPQLVEEPQEKDTTVYEDAEPEPVQVCRRHKG
jgi:hypothetical protein